MEAIEIQGIITACAERSNRSSSDERTCAGSRMVNS